MPDLARRWTREEVLALPDDGQRYELLDGELLVSPSPGYQHQFSLLALYDRVNPYVRDHQLGCTLVAPADLDLRSGQLLQPDLFVLPLIEGRRPSQGSEAGIPLLVAEILSPSTALFDRNKKRRRYQQSRVADYWIVDVDARLVERWSPDDLRPEILTEQLEWRPRPELPPLVIDLAAYFGEVWG